MTCPLTPAEAAALQEGLESALTMTCELRRPAPGAAPWVRLGSFPCYLHLTSSAASEYFNAPGHEARVNAELLLPKAAPIEPNDVALVAGHRFVAKILDPDDTGLTRALGRVER